MHNTNTLPVGEIVWHVDTGEKARVHAVQVDPQTGHVFYSLEINPDTPDRIYDTVGAKYVTTTAPASFTHSDEGDERECGGFGCGYATTDAYTVAVINDTGLCPACDRPARASDFA